MNNHPHLPDTHRDIVKLLKRADGHFNGIIDMTEVGRPCLDMAHQLHASEKVITTPPYEQRWPIEEFKEITEHL